MNDEPPNVVFTKDWRDPITEVLYTHGTILTRNKAGQYLKYGTKLGQVCIMGYFLIQDVTKPIVLK